MRTLKQTLGLICTSLLLAVSAAPNAFAAGPLAVCESGVPFVWPASGSAIPFNPDQGDLGPVAAADAVALTDDAFNVWGAVATSTANYVNAGQLPVDVDITNFDPFLNPTAPDGLSAIVFDDTGEIFDLLFGPGSGILGFAGPEWLDTAACEIIEGVSFLNGPAFTDLTAAFDVMVHEFGHYSNLAHTVVNGQLYIGAGDTTGPEPANPFPIPDPIANDIVETMYPFYFGPGIGTASLEADDVAALSTLYPDPSFAATTGSISGTIFAPDGTTRVTGVNIIARNPADPFNDAVSAISSDFTDTFDQSDPVVGTYTINGLTPGASYRVYVDEILDGGFSTPPASPLPGVEEYHSGAGESNSDDPGNFTAVSSGATGVDVIFNNPQPGVPLPLTDDGSVEVPLPFHFRLCENFYNSVFINANGSLTFGEGSADFSESMDEFLLGPPRVAGLWDDLNPAAGGEVTFHQNFFSFRVKYTDVPEFSFVGDGGSNTFEIKLYRFFDKVELKYGDLTATDGLAGVSCGGEFNSGFEPQIDLSNQRRTVRLWNKTAGYELFDADNVNDLANDRVKFTGTTFFTFDRFEFNDIPLFARHVGLPFDTIPLRRYTEISPEGNDVDWFRFRTGADTNIIAEVLTGQLDTVLGLYDRQGNQLAFDDDGGAGLLSRIVFPVTEGGLYFLAVSTADDNDFDGDGNSSGRYVLDIVATTAVPLTLGDDDSVEVDLPFPFDFQGNTYNSVFVNSNGNVTFGVGDTDFSESVAELVDGPPRIAGVWDDLSPQAGGEVLVDTAGGVFTISFIDVPQFFIGDANNFDIVLRPDGSYSVNYGVVEATDGLAGTSEGGGAADPGESDLSTGGPFPAAGTTYENFSDGDNDLGGITVDYNP